MTPRLRQWLPREMVLDPCDRRTRLFRHFGAGVDHGDGGTCRIQRVQNLHLVRSRRHINNFGNFRMKAPNADIGPISHC
jgi:hypothetical protein